MKYCAFVAALLFHLSIAANDNDHTYFIATKEISVTPCYISGEELSMLNHYILKAGQVFRIVKKVADYCIIEVSKTNRLGSPETSCYKMSVADQLVFSKKLEKRLSFNFTAARAIFKMRLNQLPHDKRTLLTEPGGLAGNFRIGISRNPVLLPGLITSVSLYSVRSIKFTGKGLAMNSRYQPCVSLSTGFNISYKKLDAGFFAGTDLFPGYNLQGKAARAVWAGFSCGWRLW